MSQFQNIPVQPSEIRIKYRCLTKIELQTIILFHLFDEILFKVLKGWYKLKTNSLDLT